MPKHVAAPTTRKCWKCKATKPIEEFYKDRASALGRQYACKICQKTATQEYARAHPAYFKEKGKQKYDPTENKGRYLKYRDSYLQRRVESRLSARGRLVDLIGSAKARATKTGLVFDLNIVWAMERLAEQKGKCCLTGISFTFEKSPYGERFYNPFAPSLDRIDSDGGYTIENTRLVCVAVNLALNRWGEDVLRQVCEGYMKTRLV